MEKPVTFQSDGNILEGLLKEGTEEAGVVISHPHPVYGGDMDNPVVESIARVYAEKGFATLRFNFRGVGGSQGHYGEGIGEQDDVRAAMAYLRQTGSREIGLAGYSFGAWVNARVGCNDIDNPGMVMVSPPAAFLDFNPLEPLPCLKIVVTGGRDDIAPATQLHPMVFQWNPAARFEIIDTGDHFYSATLTQLRTILNTVI
jgi:uncharacterized protein